MILEFGSLESARRWYDSEEYKPLIAMREAISRSTVFFIDGFDLGAFDPADIGAASHAYDENRS